MDLSSKKISNTINQRNTPNQGKQAIGKMQHLGERASLRQLTEGQVIKGEVTDLRSSQVSILLEDNTKVIGRLDNVNWLSIGDVGTFKVASVEGGSIKLQAIPLSESEMENNTMFKALEEAGLPHNSRNQSIVLSLIRNQLPITKPSILNVLKQSYELKEASISTIVLLNKYNIPATHEIASQFENYLSGGNSMVNDLNQCLDSLPTLLREMALFSDEDMTAHANQFLELINPDTASDTNELSNGSAYEFSSNRIKNEILSILSDFDLPDDITDAIRNNSLSITELNNAIQNCYESAKAIDQRNQDEFLVSLTPEELADQAKVDTSLAEIPKIVDAFDHPEFQKIQDAFQEHLKNSQLTGGFFNEQVRDNLADFLGQNPENGAVVQQVRLGSASLNELLVGIQNTIPYASPESVQQLFVSEEFMFLVSNELKKQWSMNPEDIRNKDNVATFYQKVYNQMKGLNEMMSAISPDFKESLAGTQLTAAQNNIDFMQMLNGIFPYVQLPFHANGFSGNGELYVYTKKKDLKKNPHQITVLLHLSLEHLGNLDIHIKKNGMILENQFFVEDDQSRRFVKKNINLLTEKLNGLGYSVSNEFIKKETKVDLVNDFIAQKESATTVKRYSFDIRA